MKISAMKKLLLLVLISITAIPSNAQFNFSFTDQGIPVVGTQYGVVGGVHSAMLFNRDDVSSELIKLQTMNLTYFGGVERIQWKTPHFGFGQQLLYWMGGANYKGKFSTADDAPTIDATTSTTYIKIPALFWYKSYNRWHPDRRIRVNTFFGPYVAMLIDGKENWTVNIPGSNIEQSFELKSKSFTGEDQDGNALNPGSADDGNMFKLFDYGFTMGGGLEFRLWRKTVIGLTVRADLGLAEIEDKDFEVQLQSGTRYGFYRDVLSKHLTYTSDLGVDYNHNRPETRNLSFGAQLSIRKYFGVN